jgi:hypothetical protein
MHQGQPVPCLTQPPSKQRGADAIPAHADEPALLLAASGTTVPGARPSPVAARRAGKLPGRSLGWLGHLRITAQAAQCVPVTEMLDAFARHAAGEWGQMDAHDRHQNDRALITRGRLLSVHTTRAGQPFWIITDPGWADTNVELNISDLMLSLEKC